MRILLLAAWMLTFSIGEVLAEDPPKYTPEQQEKLKIRDVWFRAANDLGKANKYKEMLAIVKKILILEREVLGETCSEVLESTVTIAKLQGLVEDFEEESKTWAELYSLRVKVFGKNHWQTVDAKLALRNSELMARLSAQQRLQLAEAKKYSADVVALHQKGKYAEATLLAEKTLRIRKEVLGEKHPDYASSLNNLANLYAEQWQHAKAEPLYIEALRIRKEVLGRKHPSYATSLHHLALMYFSQEQHAKAEPLYVEALRIRKEALGEEHADYADSLSCLALLYSSQGQYTKAEPICVESLRIRKEVLGEKHPDYAISLNNLAFLYHSQGQYDKAEHLYVEALRICKETLGEKHLSYATRLSNLALMYQSQNLYAKAEPLLVEAMQIREETLGDKHPYYASSLNNLAGLYHSQGLYAKAEPLYIFALRIRKEVLGEKHTDYAASLCSLASLYTSQGQYAKATPLSIEAMRIFKSLGEKHPDYATSLNSLARLYMSQDLYDKAEPLLVEALQIRKEVLGEKHPDYATSLGNLAVVYLFQRRFAKAESLDKEALRIRKEILGEKHADYAISLNNTAFLHESQHMYVEAEPFYIQAVKIIQDQLEGTSAIQSEADQLLFLTVSRVYLDNYVMLPESNSANLYNAVFRWRGAVTARQMFARASRISSPEIQALIEQLRDVARQMNRLTQNPPKAMPKDELAKQVKTLDAEREDLQKKLSGLSKDFAEYQQHLKLTPADLQKNLPEGTALVDFLAHGDKISAFIITKTSIQRVVLKGGKDLDEELATFLGDLSLGRTRPVTNKDDISAKLRARIWEPLEEHLKGISRVLICPDGALCRLPFAALPGSDPKKYLLEELSIVIVPVPQLLPGLLAVDAKKFIGTPSLLAVGDVNFDGDPAAGQEKKPQPVAFTRSGNGLSWGRLSNTKEEIEVVEKLFRKLPQATVEKLVKDEATEAAVERELSRHRFVHLATHGFFAPPKFVRQMQENQTIGGEKILVPVLPPGLSSGIVCAGANKPTFQASGVITATQIAELDLRNVELVVLSACETGLGELAGGEGVLGLQRAFQIAGARSTITSLWAVPDQSTAELMKRMYSNRLENGLAAAEALREAQLWVLNNGEKVGAFDQKPTGSKRTPPKFWAAFTFAGDWR